ncbi:MAG: PEP/pyruvate-binding domain-containing protein, partial [Bacteroidota bacterium]
YNQLAVAKSFKEFEIQLKNIPDESIVFHGLKNHFSIWLMAHGEIQIAKIINPVKVSDFKTPSEIRDFILDVIHKYRYNQDKGKIVQFSEEAIMDESNIVSLASGALGGKGRGLTFVNSLIYDFDFSRLVSEMHIRTPRTSIIGTDEFDLLLEKNNLRDAVNIEKDYAEIKKKFLEAELSYNLIKRLKIFLKLITQPIAIRSSSLFEDSLMQPFSGIFATYLLPNNHPDLNIRLKQAMDAIKLVYASIYSPDSKRYFEAINYKIEEEKMAVIIQDVVGNMYDQYFYPHISGTAQSHNYYPVSHMKPDEGFAVAAVGLGIYVVEGEKSYRFSPKYPQIEINSPKDLYKSSQVDFFAVDLNKQNLNLLEGEEAGLIKLDITTAESHGTIKHTASVYDIDNERITPGIETNGPRIINFSNILKFNYIPLSQTLITTLDLVKEALGSPVEIEYAIDLNRDKNGLPSFYLLQIKPLVGNDEDYNIDLDKIDENQILLYAEKSMGNGKIDTLTDIVFVEPKAFDNLKTMEMTYEIEQINEKFMRENRKYILMGPGRWGTRDRFIGIPVAWPQICNAKIIVEMSLEDFPLDASLGSHFFHNVTSMNVGYFSIQHSLSSNFINWEFLKSQKLIEKTKYFKHVRFDKPLEVIMDGKKRISLIMWKK